MDGNTKQFRAPIQAISEGVDTRVENDVQDRYGMLMISKLHIFWHSSMHLFYLADIAGRGHEMDDLKRLIRQGVGCGKRFQRQNQLESSYAWPNGYRRLQLKIDGSDCGGTEGSEGS